MAKMRDLNPLDLFDLCDDELRELERRGIIKITPVSDAGDGMDYIEIIKGPHARPIPTQRGEG